MYHVKKTDHVTGERETWSLNLLEHMVTFNR